MQPEFIQRLIALMEKTGDRVVFADQATGKAIVLMDLEAYERLHGVRAEAQAKLELTDIASPVAQPLPREVEPIAAPAPKKVAAPLLAARTAKTRPATPEPQPKDFAILTQDELLERITSDISVWKQVQERKRADALRGAVQKPAARAVAEDAREEEERFYLEPIS
jgi:hypothetical protein